MSRTSQCDDDYEHVINIELMEKEKEAKEKEARELKEKELQAKEKEAREKELQAKEKEAKEAKEKELQAKEKEAKEAKEKEAREKELQAEKEAKEAKDLKELQEEEKELQEEVQAKEKERARLEKLIKEAKEKELKEKEAKEAKEKELKEKELKEKELKEKEAKEAKEKELKEKEKDMDKKHVVLPKEDAKEGAKEKENKEEDNKEKVFVSIDFGTAETGYAFSYANDPSQIFAHHYKGRNKELTAVLLDEKLEFVAFGEEAESTYHSSTDGKTSGYLLFRKFKMALFGENWNRKTLMVEAENGTKAPAFTVITRCLEYLAELILARLQYSSISGYKLKMSNIKWMLSLPAIWSSLAKEFMRDAAFEAKMIATRDSKKLQLVLESEACSIHCFRNEMKLAEEASTLKDFTYMVVDLGGGTADFTVHRVSENKKLDELANSDCNGGPWGSTYIDQGFIRVLEAIIGKKTLDEFKKTCTAQWLVMMKEFDRIKTDLSYIRPKAFSRIFLSEQFLHVVNQVAGEKFNQLLTRYLDQKSKEEDEKKKQPVQKESEVREKVDVVGEPPLLQFERSPNTLKLSWKFVKSLFDAPVNKILNHISEQLKSNDSIRYILLCGGFANSNVVQTMVSNHVKQKALMIVVPPNPDGCVLRGSLAYAADSSLIQSRIARFSYSILTTTRFNSEREAKEHHEHVAAGYRNGRLTWRVNDILSNLCEAGTSIPVDHVVPSTKYYPASDDQTSVRFTLMKTKKTNIKFVCQDPDIVECATIIISSDDGTAFDLSEEFGVRVKFGGSEIEVTAYEVATGKSKKASIRFSQL
jgi:hypothetical protein